MTKMRLTDLVRHNGQITTIADLADKGLIEFKECKNFYGGRSTRIAYFADIIGSTAGWEIGKMAYFSRTKQKITF